MANLRGVKIGNEYSAVVPNYRATPKAVLAAIAFSLAMRLSEDRMSAAASLIQDEWDALYTAGIVPQRSPFSGVAKRT